MMNTELYVPRMGERNAAILVTELCIQLLNEYGEQPLGAEDIYIFYFDSR